MTSAGRLAFDVGRDGGFVVRVEDLSQRDVGVLRATDAARGPSGSYSADSKRVSSSRRSGELRRFPLPAVVDPRQSPVVELIEQVEREVLVFAGQRVVRRRRDGRHTARGLCERGQQRLGCRPTGAGQAQHDALLS